MENAVNEHEVNLNKAEVIKDESHFGFTIHHNISKGTQVRVPWGSLDWFILLGVTLFFLTFLAAFGSMIVSVLWRL